jgi:hypothetical protein
MGKPRAGRTYHRGEDSNGVAFNSIGAVRKRQRKGARDTAGEDCSQESNECRETTNSTTQGNEERRESGVVISALQTARMRAGCAASSFNVQPKAPVQSPWPTTQAGAFGRALDTIPFDQALRACCARVSRPRTEFDRWSPKTTVYTNSGRPSVGPSAGSGDPRRTVN